MGKLAATALLFVFSIAMGPACRARVPLIGQAPAGMPGATITPSATTASAATYVGSATCRRCHALIYERWSKTRMANVIVDPRMHPEAVLPDFDKPDPLLTFPLDAVAFVYGSKWKQRYFTKVGDDYFPLPAQWDVRNKRWRPYMVQPNTDWWVQFFPADNMKRPTGPLCDGCHSVNYNIATRAVTEWNVGCERCHGPGSEHAQWPRKSKIINPKRMDAVRATDTCVQCHSQGRPLQDPIAGQHYDWPVGFHQGLDLKDFWQLEEYKLGETTFTAFADGTAHKNRMQGNDFVQSVMYTKGVTCASCHDVHGTPNNADLVKPVKELCLTCHAPNSRNGPRGATIEAHTQHLRGSSGSECVACHMPQIEQTIADVNVRSHTFRFITPGMTDQLKIPNPCTSCHTNRDTTWARAAMKRWRGTSPWRVS